MERHVAESSGTPALPPSPLAVERRTVAIGEVVLPWSTVPLGLLVGLVALVPWALARTRGAPAYFAYYLPPILMSSVATALLTLGITACDRFRRWPRAARWAMGAAAGGLLPISTVVFSAFPRHPHPGPVLGSYLVGYAVAEVSCSVGVGALLGGALGAAAASGRKLFVHLFVAGGLVGQALGLALWAMPTVWAPATGSALRLSQVARCAPLVYAVQTFPLVWVLLPILLAERLTAARRALAPGAETWIEASGLQESLRVHRPARAVIGLLVVAMAGGLLYRLYVKPCVIDHNALTYAAATGDVVEVRKLLDRGVDPDVGGLRGWRALHGAAYYAQYETAKLLLEAGADPNVASQVTRSAPLHCAAGCGGSRVTALLLQYGADPDAKCRAAALYHAGVGDGLTPLHVAAYGGDTGSILALVRHGARVNEGTSLDVTPLHIAAVEGSLRAVELLVERGASVDAADRDGRTALHMAAYSDDVPTEEALLSCGADVWAGVGGCGTPLHYAARRAGPAMIRSLVAHGAPVDARDDQGGTPLHVAASHGNLPAAEALLGTRADAGARTDNGRTPLDVAIRHRSSGVAQLLRERGAKG